MAQRVFIPDPIPIIHKGVAIVATIAVGLAVVGFILALAAAGIVGLLIAALALLWILARLGYLFAAGYVAGFLHQIRRLNR